MVIRTRNCDFSEYQIYPGRGIIYVARDGSSKLYISKKSMNLDKQKTKPHMIRWTTAWRRKNKKLKVTGIKKKRRRKGRKLQRAIAGGMSVEKQMAMRKQYQNRKPDEKTVNRIRTNKRNTKKKYYGGQKSKVAKQGGQGKGR